MKMVQFQCKCGRKHMVMTKASMIYVCGNCSKYWSLMPEGNTQAVEIAPTAVGYYLQHGIPVVHEDEYVQEQKEETAALNPNDLPIKTESALDMNSLYTGFLYGLKAAKNMA